MLARVLCVHKCCKEKELKKKVEVIKYAKIPQASTRELGEKFQCGKTQITMILKNQDSILLHIKSNASGSKVHATMPLNSWM